GAFVAGDDAPEPTGEIDHERLAVAVLGERHDGMTVVADDARLARARARIELVDHARRVVRVDQVAAHLGDGRPAVCDAERDRADVGVWQRGDRRDRVEPRAASGLHAPRALGQRPGIIARTLDAIDLFDAIFADVAVPQLAGLAIEREPPRIAQAERPHLGRTTVAHERVVVRNRVGLRAV